MRSVWRYGAARLLVASGAVASCKSGEAVSSSDFAISVQRTIDTLDERPGHVGAWSYSRGTLVFSADRRAIVLFDERRNTIDTVAFVAVGDVAPGVYDAARAGLVGDKLWAYNRAGKITVIPLRGGKQQHLQLPTSYARSPDWELRAGTFSPRSMLPDSSLIGLIRFARSPAAPNAYADCVCRVSLSGRVMRHLASVSDSAHTVRRIGLDGSELVVGIPFAPRPRVSVSRDGAFLAMLMSSSNAIFGKLTLARPSGDVLFEKRYQVGQTGLSRTNADSFAKLLRRLAERQIPRDVLDEVDRRRPTVDDEVQRLLVGIDGSVAIVRKEIRGQRQLTVFDSTGLFRGTLVVARRADVVDFSLSEMLVTERVGVRRLRLLRYRVRSTLLN